MADSLTRMAERAMGLKPVAVPLLRPVFAPSRQLDTPSLTETPPQTQRLDHVSQQEPSRINENARDVRDQDRAARQTVDHVQQEESGPSRAPRMSLAKPTLEEVVHRIFGPAEEPEAYTSSQPAKQREIISVSQGREISNGPEQERSRRIEPQADRVVEATHVTREPKAPAEANTALTRSRIIGPANITADPPSRDVHISIGRIELKAAAPVSSVAPRPLAPAPRRAHLSLEEYLKQRKGAGH